MHIPGKVDMEKKVLERVPIGGGGVNDKTAPT